MALKRHRLCQRRKALGFSQERLAELLGVERSTVVRWENAETDPQPWHRTRIASALGVTLELLDDMLVDVSVAAHRGQAMGDDARSPASGPACHELLNGLRTFLTSYLPAPAGPPPSLVVVRRAIGRVHNLYQRASYTSAARLLPDVLSQATALTDDAAGLHRSSAFRLLAAAYIAASKLAAKVGDGDTALLTADRASTAARLADDQALAAVAAYQAACGLMQLPGRAAEAEHVVRTSIDRLAGPADDPDLLSAQGSLLLLAALMAAGQGSRKETGQLLAQAGERATVLGSDRNRLWTGFGPTNVVIHAVSAAVRAGNAEQALEVGSRLDTSRLPAVLVGRRTQVHLDLAAAALLSSGDRSVSVLHLLEAERVGAEVVHASVQARSLLLDLLAKERRAATPGLRPLAERAGLLA
ncbi:helix-turn-helix transcriptional regulator [Micromonospora sp. NPDC005299]|uniref:helix-turn-helix transcriptional regulator n=1 Tax=Micromonospora sp. NPDC005299 TaxID=3364231 RepID=UPI003685A1CC